MHNSDTGSSIYTRKMTIKNTRCVYFFFPTITFPRTSARFDFRHSQRNRGGWFPSVISNAHTHTHMRARARIARGYLGGNLERVYNKPLFFVPFFFFFVVSDMRSSSQKIIVRYFLQFIPDAFACAPYRESSAREIIIRHFFTTYAHCARVRAREYTPICLPTEGARVTVLCRVVEYVSPSV